MAVARGAKTVPTGIAASVARSRAVGAASTASSGGAQVRGCGWRGRHDALASVGCERVADGRGARPSRSLRGR